MYRFLLSPQWIGLAVLMTCAAAVMVGLGLWQLDRYHQRSEINARIDAAGQLPPSPMDQVLAPPPPAGGVGAVGPPPQPEVRWARVVVTGAYDPGRGILARSRTVGGWVGFEVLTPLVLPDGTAVLVDRGWLPPAAADAATPPEIPPAPAGQVTVVGRVHAPESRASAAEPFGSLRSVRRISPALLASDLPYPLYGAYLTLEEQTPPADPTFVAIPPGRENAWMNAGYVVQWWAFAALTLAGYAVLAIRQERFRREWRQPVQVARGGAVHPGGGYEHDDVDRNLDGRAAL